MNIIIDLDLQQAVQAWGSRQPAQPIQVKSQDTPTLAIYFAKGAINYDIGTSPGLRFGVYVAGNPNPLVQQTSFTRTTDAQNRVLYVAYPNFNTTAMLAAIGSQQSISATGEVRYQTSFGTIARTLDVPFTILRSLLQETIMDTTIAAFTTSAIGSNVTVRINNTGWLAANLNISIGAGAGAYKVISITNVTDFVAQNSGGASNAASGTVIATGTSVGLAPAQILNAYPDPSIIEITTHKNAANGYAGLTAGSILPTSVIPVDTQTIRFNTNNQLSSSAILTLTTANFTTPAANATVSVTLASTAGLIAGQYVRIAVAGYYKVTSITDSTHAVLTNNGDPFNAGSGITITSGAVLLPAQAAAGGGSPGQNAYTQTTAAFTVPAVGATVSVAVGVTSWMGGNGYYVFITGAGYYAVSSITDATHAVLTNGGGASNAIAGTTVPSGSTVSAAGPAGAAGTPGAPGAALSAYDALASSFVMPAAAASVTISIANTAWMAVGQVIYIASAGYFQVASISSATQASVTNLNYPGNASAGGTIASGSKVSAGGLIGATGSGGAGKNAFTNLAANFTQPSVNATVSINVGTTAWMALAQIIFVQGGGYYSVASITDLTDAIVTNLGYAGNAAPTATVTSGSTVAVTPGGLVGQAGADSFTTTTASFTQPTSGSTVTVTVANTSWIAQGQNLFIPGAGYYSVSVVTDATHVVLTNSGVAGSASAGTTIASGSKVSPAGAQGQQGIQGVQGAPGSLSSLGDTLSTATGTEVSMQTGASAGVGYIKKLKAGSNITLTDQGGSTGDVLIAASGGGGGGFDPRSGLYIYEEFITRGPTTAPFPFAFNQSQTGTAAAVQWGNLNNYFDSTHKANGYIELQTGNVTGNSGAILCYGSGLNPLNAALVLGPGIMDLASRMMIETSLPATGNGYIARFGLAAITNLGTWPIAFVNSVFLEYSPDNNSGNLRLGYNTASGGITYVNTSQALTADTFAWWEIKIDASGNITAYFNGASIATAGPIAGLLGVPLSPFWLDFRNAGTAVIYLAVDTLFASMPYTR
jgi:hypothetical protein